MMPLIRKAVLLLALLISPLSFADEIQGKVLVSTENLKLVELANHRQAVYITMEDGETKLLGYVGKVRKGTEFFHWGQGTPEQAEAWDKAGRISPDLLSRLKVDNNFGALGGGFYASLSRTDSSSYGNVQIILRMPHDMKIVSGVEPYHVSGEVWVKVVAQLEKLGISALQNKSTPTWFNIIDAEVLTQEHVAKARDWKGQWEKADSYVKADIISKFPDIYLTPSLKLEVSKYMYHWKMLTSADQRYVYAAFKYFTSIKDREGIDYSLSRIDNKYRAAVLKEVTDSFQRMTPAEKANFIRSENLKLSSIYNDIFQIAARERDPLVRMAVLESVRGNTDKNSMEIIRAGTQDADRNVRIGAYNSLTGRRDSEAWQLLKNGMQDSEAGVRQAVISAVDKSHHPETMSILRLAIKDANPDVRQSVLYSLWGRKDQDSLELLQLGVRDTDPSVRYTAAHVAAGRSGMKSLDMTRTLLKSSDSHERGRGLDILSGRQDADSLKIILGSLKDKDSNVRVSAINALRNRKANIIDILKDAYKDSDPEVRATVMRVINGRKDRKSFELIRLASNDKDSGVRESAMEALQGFTGKETLIIIKQALRDPDAQLRRAAVGAIAGFTGPEYSEVIRTAMADTDEWVRHRAVITVQMKNDDFAFEILKAAVSDPSSSVRYSAMGGLDGYANKPEVTDILKQLMNDPDQWIRDQASMRLKGQIYSAVEDSMPTVNEFAEKLTTMKQKVQEMASIPRCEGIFLK